MTRVGATYEAGVILSSLAPGKGTLTLTENDTVVFKDEVEFDSGKTRFAFPLYARGAGYYEYVARIKVPEGEDGRIENNEASNSLYLQGEGRVLMITDRAGDPADWQLLKKAIQDEGRAVETLDAASLWKATLLGANLNRAQMAGTVLPDGSRKTHFTSLKKFTG